MAFWKIESATPYFGATVHMTLYIFPIFQKKKSNYSTKIHNGKDEGGGVSFCLKELCLVQERISPKQTTDTTKSLFKRFGFIFLTKIDFQASVLSLNLGFHGQAPVFHNFGNLY